MVLERLAEVISTEKDLRVCGQAEDVPQALSMMAEAKPDLAIVDLTLKHSYGLELIKDIHVRWPQMDVLVVSMHDEWLHAERALRAGARGYITKQEATTQILQAIRRVLGGEIYLSETMAVQIAGKIVGHTRASAAVSIDRLSDRELQVLELIGQGYGTRQIATELHLDAKTIETYRARIKEKLNLRDAAEVLQHAIRWRQATPAV